MVRSTLLFFFYSGGPSGRNPGFYEFVDTFEVFFEINSTFIGDVRAVLFNIFICQLCSSGVVSNSKVDFNMLVPGRKMSLFKGSKNQDF